MSKFYNAQGEIHEVPLNVQMYREAAERGMTLPQYINANYTTDTGRFGNTFEQMCASEGIFVKSNKDVGVRASTMDEILNPKGEAGVVTKESVPQSRIMFPAVVMQAVEDKLTSNLTMTGQALNSMIASDESIAGDRYEYPVLNFDKPEAARSRTVAQLANPQIMGTLTVSDKSGKIPSFGLGLEVSDQALRAFPIDVLALSLARQASVEQNERAQNYMQALLNGDVDNGEQSLAALGLTVNSSTLDPAATGGNLTQEAWTKFLVRRATQRTVTHLVCDVKSALAIENRTGRPTNSTDDPKSPRINTQMSVANPLWPTNVSVFLTVDPNWPANTIMAIDKAWAIRRIRSLLAEYSAIEEYVIRRSKVMRFDFGEVVHRLFPEAFDTLVLQ